MFDQESVKKLDSLLAGIISMANDLRRDLTAEKIELDDISLDLDAIEMDLKSCFRVLNAEYDKL